MPVATPVVSPSNLPYQVGTRDPQGEKFGLASTDLISFYGNTPVAQPSGNAQAAVTRGQACGVIMSITSPQSPSAVQAGTSAEATFTLIGATGAVPVASTDLVYVNKPTTQAGLGVGNVRGSGVNTVGVSFTNLTGTTITPTASEAYSVIALRGFNTLTATLSPAAVQANTTTEQLFSVTGLRTGEVVQVNKPSVQAGLEIVGCRVSANNQVGITFMNVTGTTITPTGSESYAIFSLGGMDAVNNEVQLQITASPVSVQANTIAEYSMPVSNLLLGDTVKGIAKPSSQAGLGIVGMRVSVPSTIGVTFINNTGTTITPTAGEVYEIALVRAAPVAPCVTYSAVLSPSAVPGASSAEQTFTITGLIASSAVWVNKPTQQPGLGIAGVRVSAANTLAINFCNTNLNSLTPTAAETYVVANFQDVTQTGGVFSAAIHGNSLNKSAVGAEQSSNIQGNATRNALATLGLIAGS